MIRSHDHKNSLTLQEYGSWPPRLGSTNLQRLAAKPSIRGIRLISSGRGGSRGTGDGVVGEQLQNDTTGQCRAKLIKVVNMWLYM